MISLAPLAAGMGEWGRWCSVELYVAKVVPAQAGIKGQQSDWMPAQAGMTGNHRPECFEHQVA
jgi:hypothetical protein